MIDGATQGDAIEAMCWQTLAPVLLDALASPSHAPVVVMGVARVGDPGATRTVYASVVVLTFLGLVLATLAIWVFRRTRPEPELLAPLETMQTRGWRRLDPAAQRRSLDESRPNGAAPLRREASEPAVDSSFATVAPVSSFDDLSDRAGDSEGAPGGDRDAGGANDDDVVGPDVAEVVAASSAGTVESDVADTQDPPEGDAQTAGDDELASAEPEISDDTGELSNHGEFDLETDDLETDDLETEDLETEDLETDDLETDDLEVAPAGRQIDPLLAPKSP